MSFKHPIDDVIYDVVWYRLEDSVVTGWCVMVGMQEMPYHHLSETVIKELEWQCRVDNDATEKDGALFAAECQAVAA